MFPKYLKFIFICALFTVVDVIQAVRINEIIEQIPLDDRKDLERLFYRLINDDHLGYTLFGDKPVSIGSYFKITPWENFLELGQYDGTFWKKWEVWEKYKDKFNIQNYIFLKETSNLIDQIVIINKKAFIETLNKHLGVFEGILNKKINPLQFLAQIEQGKTSFSGSIQDNDILLGICLGYGKHNAMLYHQRGKILRNSSLNFFGDYNSSLVRIKSLHFMADHSHPETRELERKYQKLRAKISTIYANDNFLEATLSQLIAN